MLSGGDGNDIAASMFGNPGDSGNKFGPCGTSNMDLTMMLPGFLGCLDDFGDVFFDDLVLGKAESLPLSGDFGDVVDDASVPLGPPWRTLPASGKLIFFALIGGVAGSSRGGACLSSVGEGEGRTSILGAGGLLGPRALRTTTPESPAWWLEPFTEAGLLFGDTASPCWISSHSSTSLINDFTPRSAVVTLIDNRKELGSCWFGCLDTTAATSPALVVFRSRNLCVLELVWLLGLWRSYDDLGARDSVSMALKRETRCDLWMADRRD